MFSKKSKIFLAGHNGMVGSAIYRKLKKLNFKNVIISPKKKLNLLDQKKTYKFLKKIKPDYVIIAAARVGGIKANNDFKSKFIYENLTIQNNLIHGSYLAKVKNLLFLGSSCIYPRNCKQPIKEKYILSGPLEKTNDAYAIAKIAGLFMCKFYSENYNLNYKSLMPTNMYGPNDNYDLETSHFFPALIRKAIDAAENKKKYIFLWGNGKAKRELLFVDDFADAAIFFLKRKISEPFLNIGSGKDYSIEWYAKFILRFLKTKTKIKYIKNTSNGTPRKLLDITLAQKYGWKSRYSLIKGLEITCREFKKNKKNYLQ